jgi:2-C-methyl-D-erythritol 2,4-cyclodiphosphate synthase
VLGGVRVPFELGLEGHSDGDVLLHAVTDALLGAQGIGDLGRHFPSSRADLRGIESSLMLAQVAQRARESGFRLANLDATIIAERPRLAGYLDEMEKAIAAALAVELERVNVKVTSSDGLGATGRGEGIAALAVVLLEEGA